MPLQIKYFYTFLFSLFISALVTAQTETKAELLKTTAQRQSISYYSNYQKALQLAKQKHWALEFTGINANTVAHLVGVDTFGLPIYFTTYSNALAASTSGVNQLYQGGTVGANVSGASNNVKGKIALWDGGAASNTHVELEGRIVSKDGATINSHSTHVAGTLMASGINPFAKGMAYATPELSSYDFNNHTSEMSSAAAGLLLSNHSYGTVAGWSYNSGFGRWEFRGRPNENEDYKFGYYDADAQLFDSIAYNAPYYLIVKSSGNNRNENGPAIGSDYWRFDAGNNLVDAGARPTGISNNNGYDIIPTYGCAKNVLTVGAVGGIINGYTDTSDAIMSEFSSWGPTDDGRIKPDIVADGVNILSCVAGGNTAYDVYNGTSMAAPVATGSLYLLQELYNNIHPANFMRSATLKALAIHTANEAGGYPGPDYKFGWGLLNVEKAAQLIKANKTDTIIESVLNNGQTYSINVIANSKGKITATLAWTDPKGNVEYVNVLNNTALKLINDLDIRITDNSNIYKPWCLDPANPANAAFRGDNYRDNVEKAEVENIIPGQTYTINITHKGILERGSQAFSLIISGIGGMPYCSSAASNNAGTRINYVNIAGINNVNAAGCTTYNNFSSITASVEPNTSYPLTVALNSCDASANSKIVKVFIDFNGNGSFGDAGELVATSAVLPSVSTFSTNISIPNSVPVNSYSIMRIIAQETTNANDINFCGNYANGETQDYSIHFIKPAVDAAVTEIVAPTTNGAYSNINQYLSVRIANKGTQDINTIPVSAIIKNGATTIATQNAVYRASIKAGKSVVYTFQKPFNAVASGNYQIIVNTALAGDQSVLNDTLKQSVSIAPQSSAPSGQAQVCGNTAQLNSFSNENNLYWFSHSNSIKPIAGGSSVNTDSIANPYYIGYGVAANIGIVSKNSFPSGGGYQAKGANAIKYTATVPVTLQTAKLFTGYPGKFTIIAADNYFIDGAGKPHFTILASTTIDVYATRPTLQTGDVDINDAADTGAYFNINLPLPQGNHYIVCYTDSIANIFRNNNITGSPYPFRINDVFSITGNSANSVSDPNFFQGYYYYLYDMAINTNGSQSDKVAVNMNIVPKPTITRVGDSLVSSDANSYQWIFNGTEIISAMSKVYSPLQDGKYVVRITDPTGCVISSDTFNFIRNQTTNTAALMVYPNPAKYSCTLKLNSASSGSIEVSIINSLGKICAVKNYAATTGSFIQTLPVGNLVNGIYIVKVKQSNNLYTQKLIITR